MFALLPIATNSSSKQVSSFSSYVEEDFDINTGKKVLCFFDAGCDHCMDAAKSLAEFSSQLQSFADVHIIFSDSRKVSKKISPKKLLFSGWNCVPIILFFETIAVISCS